ncbi:RNA polymerase I termination factor [Monosporozyma servazzii]
MSNDGNNSAGSLNFNKQQAITDNNNRGVDVNISNNDSGFDVTVEEAVFKYVRNLNFDCTSNASNNTSPYNLTNEADHDNINNANSLSPSLEWYLKDDSNFEYHVPDEENKRELYELDQVYPSKKSKQSTDVEKTNTDEIAKQPQDDWINSDFFSRDEEASLDNPQFYCSQTIKPINSSSNITSFQAIASNTNANLPSNQRFQKILPKTKDVKHHYSNSLSGEVKRKREINLLIEEILGKILQLSTEIKSQLKFAPEEDVLIKEFVSRYKSIQGLTKSEITHMIWHSNTFVDDFDNSLEKKEEGNNFSAEMIDSFWTSVYSIFPYRLNSSIHKHLKRLYNNFDKRGKWTNKEDTSLNDLCTTKGLMGQWLQIGYILNRMPEDCRDRWRNYVMCQGKQKMNQWSIQEEEKLLVIIFNALKSKAVEIGGDKNVIFTENGLFHDEELFKLAINWTQVSETMGLTRSRIQCRYKWNKLFRRIMLKRIDNDMDNDCIRKILSICKQKWNSVNEIDWEQLSKDIDLLWYPKELKLLFEVRGKRVKNYKDKSLKEVCADILVQLKE